jgi:Domain of unknown function (DUF5666)
MSVTYPSARLTRLALITVTGATALSVAACGASNNAKPAPSASPTSSTMAPSSPSVSANGKGWVSGMIASVSGDGVQVTQQTGNATVDFTPSTKITELTPAQLSDVTAGSCVTVRPTRGSVDTGGAVTAKSVRVSPAAEGKCPEPKHHAGIAGTVASVAGDTITVNDANGNSSPSIVTVTDTTKYTKQAATDAQALAQGKCIAARGTQDNTGTLQTMTVSVQQADNGGCPRLGAGHHQH